MSISVILADDHSVVREGLKCLLSRTINPEIRVLAEAASGREVVSLTDQIRADVLIMDISMPGLNGIDAARIICKRHPDIRIIALSIHKNKSYVLQMFGAGAHAYIPKDSVVEEIIHAVKAVVKGEHYLSDKLGLTTTDIKNALEEKEVHSDDRHLLSSREREVLQLITEGKGTKEAARILNRSVKTIESHRKNIMDKLHIYSVAELTSYAIEQGMIQVDTQRD